MAIVYHMKYKRHVFIRMSYLAFLFVSTIFSENRVVHLFLFVFTVVFLFVYLRSRCILFVYLRPRLYIVSNVACGSRWPNC